MIVKEKTFSAREKKTMSMAWALEIAEIEMKNRSCDVCTAASLASCRIKIDTLELLEILRLKNLA